MQISKWEAKIRRIRIVTVQLCLGAIFLPSMALSRKMTPQEYFVCASNYWEPRFKGEMIAAEAALGNAKTAYNPSISGSLVRAGDVLKQSASGYTYGSLTLKQNIISLSNNAVLTSSELNLKAAKLSIENQLLELAENNARDIYNYLQTKFTVNLLKKRIPRIDQMVQLSKELSRLKLSDYSSVLSAQVNRLALDSNIKSNETQVFNQWSSLQSNLGITESNDFEIEENYEPNVDTTWSFWEKKIDHLPAVVSLKNEIQSLVKTAEAYKLQYVPALSISTTAYQYPNELSPPDGRTAVVQLNLSIPIYDQGVSSVSEQQALAQMKLKESILASTREKIRNNLKLLLNQINKTEQIIKLLKEQREKSQQAYDAMVALFEFGKTNFLNVSTAESNLINVEIQLLTAQYSLASVKTQLEIYSDYVDGKLQLMKRKCILGQK